jgi:outer membrane protein assembly factor BamB
MAVPKDGTLSRVATSLCAIAAILCALIALSPSARAGAPAASEWRQTDCDSSHTRSIRTPIAPPLKTIWSVPIDAETGPVVAMGDSVHVLGRHSIYAVRARNGKVRWTHRFNADLAAAYDANTQFTCGSGFFANGSILYCTAPDLQTVALLSERTGKLLGEQAIGMNLACNVLTGYLRDSCLSISSASPYGDLSSSNPLFVLRDANGVRKAAPQPTPRLVSSNPIRIGTLGEKSGWLYVQFHHVLQTFDGPSGSRRGNYYLTDSRYTETVADATHVYISENGSIKCLSRDLKPIWANNDLARDKRATRAVPRPLLLTPNVLVYCNWARMAGFDKLSGRRLWTITLPGQHSIPWYDYTRPILAGSFIYVAIPKSDKISHGHGPFPNTLICVNARTGRIIWRKKIGTEIVSMIAHRGSLYVLDNQSPLRGRDMPMHRRLLRLDPVRLARRGRRSGPDR